MPATRTSSAGNGPAGRGAAISRTSRRSTAQVFCEVARSTDADIERPWTPRTPPPPSWQDPVAERYVLLNKIADVIDANLEPTRSRSHQRQTRCERNAQRRHSSWRWTISGISPRRSPLPGLDLRDRRRQSPTTRATGRGGTDHPLELPDSHGGVKLWPQPWRGTRSSAQAHAEQTPASVMCLISLIAPICFRQESPQRGQRIRRRAGRSHWRRATGSPRSLHRRRPPPAGSSCSTPARTSSGDPGTGRQKNPNIFFSDVMGQR